MEFDAHLAKIRDGIPLSAPTFPLRHFLERLAADAATLSAETHEQARRELADDLNQAVRRLRQSPTIDELVATLADTAGRFADGAVVFQLADGMAKSEKMDLAIPLDSAAALAGAVQSRDPVTAITTDGEVSEALVERLGHSPEGRAHIHPVVVKDGVPALLYAWGAVQSAAVELVAQVAAAVWVDLLPPPPVVELVSIAPLSAAAKPASSWESLTPEEQQVHLRAQRFARVQVATMRLQCGAEVQAGRLRHNLYEALREPIDAARTLLRKDFFTTCPSMVDYLHLELVHTLANDDAELLGKDYPGPMV
jgi:hypothetical protein